MIDIFLTHRRLDLIYTVILVQFVKQSTHLSYLQFLSLLLFVYNLYSKSDTFDVAGSLPFHDFTEDEFIIFYILIYFYLNFTFGFFGWNLHNCILVLGDTELEIEGAKLYQINFVTFFEFWWPITWMQHFNRDLSGARPSHFLQLHLN